MRRNQTHALGMKFQILLLLNSHALHHLRIKIKSLVSFLVLHIDEKKYNTFIIIYIPALLRLGLVSRRQAKVKTVEN